MKITLQNCNNIEKGEINIEKNKLNIKFGINGTGKSTLAKAIQYKIENAEKLKDLLPFKLRGENPENTKSEVEIDEGINLISIFNEEYVNQFLFKQDELISNSFEIFIKTPEYIKKEEKIEKELKEIKKIFLNNEELESIISDFESLSKSFKTTQSGLSNASAIAKGLEDGNKIENIPENLIEYKPFLQDNNKCVSWLDWQIKGNAFSESHDTCPYCVSPTNEEKKQKIKSVSDNYDKNIIKNFIEIIRVLENLGDYFSPNAKNKLDEIVKKTDGLLEEEKIYLTTIKGQIDTFLQRLKKLKELSFYNLKNDSNIEKAIKELKINIDELFDKLNSDKTKEIVNKFNTSLNNTLTKITDLQKAIGIQKTAIRNSITTHKKNINQFLKNAGYKYQVIITDEQNEYKIKLQHIDLDENIQGGNQYLSFGEKNAFALVLFMHEALSKNSDLIILDDPISSFDKNKKYAILQMLFREPKSLKGKTVLMLTHDFEPIIDTQKALFNKFKDQSVASFLAIQDGCLTEEKITKDDILTFSQICEKIISDKDISIISKLVYLRRNFEILDDKGDEYQLLSDLLHRRTKEEAKQNRGISDPEFETSFNNAITKIGEIINGFDYEELLKLVKDKNKLKSSYENAKSSYEKLQIFRIINKDFTGSTEFSDVMKKFINETYHIENDFIHQLDHTKYNIIPEYIIKECDDFITRY